MKEFIDFLLGGMPVAHFAVFTVLAYAGMIAHIVFEVIDRKPKTGGVPFNFGYWWRDNRMKLFFTVLLMPVLIVVVTELLGIRDGASVDTRITKASAFLIGYAFDQIGRFLRRKNIFANAEKGKADK